MSVSVRHELPVDLLRERPELLLKLLEWQPGVVLPRFARIDDRTNDLTQPLPVEIRADLVLVLCDAADRPVLGLVAEVQGAKDKRKRDSWLLYGAALQARIRAPAWVVVIALTPQVAAWAREPIPVGPTRVAYPLVVIGPEQIPRLTPAQAAEMPELAVLSASIHGNEPDGWQTLDVVFAAILGLDEDRRAWYLDLVYYTVNQAAKRYLEQLMQAGTHRYRSEFARTFFAQGEAKGRADGEAKGRADGEAKGRADGEAKGRTDGEAEALLAVLKARRVSLKRQERAQILSCRDSATLLLWLTRAATARSAAEVFGSASAAER